MIIALPLLFFLFLFVAFPNGFAGKPRVGEVAGQKVQDIADEAMPPPKEEYSIQQKDNNLPDYYKWVIEIDEDFSDKKLEDISLRLLGDDAKYIRRGIFVFEKGEQVYALLEYERGNLASFVHEERRRIEEEKARLPQPVLAGNSF